MIHIQKMKFDTGFRFDKMPSKPNPRYKTSHSSRVKHGVCCMNFWVLKLKFPSCCQVKLQRGTLICFGCPLSIIL